MEWRKHGRPPVNKPVYDRVRCVEELHHLLRSVVMIRRLKKEVGGCAVPSCICLLGIRQAILLFGLHGLTRGPPSSSHVSHNEIHDNRSLPSSRP